MYSGGLCGQDPVVFFRVHEYLCVYIFPLGGQAQPHAAMLHTCDRVFQSYCDAGKQCDVLQCIFQHIGIFAPDFGISQPFIIRFSNGLQHYDGDSIRFHVICE